MTESQIVNVVCALLGLFCGWLSGAGFHKPGVLNKLFAAFIVAVALISAARAGS